MSTEESIESARIGTDAASWPDSAEVNGGLAGTPPGDTAAAELHPSPLAPPLPLQGGLRVILRRLSVKRSKHRRTRRVLTACFVLSLFFMLDADVAL